MALKGNLRDFSLSQLLNLINLSKKTGSLFIESSQGLAQLAFRNGKLVYAGIGSDENNLSSILYHSNRINQSQYRVLQERITQMTDKETGLLLINAGYSTYEEILSCIQNYYIEVVRKMFTWLEGEFHFENDGLSFEEKITINLDLENLIVEGSRQIKEWEHLQEEIPSLDLAMQFSEHPDKNISNMNLNVEEWRVVSFINPKNTIRQIARATHLNDMEIRRVIYGLMQAGMIEYVHAEASPILHDRMFPTKDRQQQRSLINRIIDKIRSI
ncbi:MAG: DUF4388 domain-containing protein [Anaerolineaceae bacterium]